MINQNFFDNSYLYDAVYSSIQVLDKRLYIETVVQREMLNKREIIKLSWVSTNE